jgi:hypothetical protein
MGQQGGIGLPAGGAEMLVDQLAGGSLVQGDALASGPGTRNEGVELFGRSFLGLLLKALQLGGEGNLGLLGLLGQGEGGGEVLRFLPDLLFRRQAAPLGLAGRSQRGRHGRHGRRGRLLRRQLPAHLSELGLESFDLPHTGALFNLRIGRRDERPRLERGVRKGALEPGAQHPGEAEMEERLAVAPGGLVGRLIAGPAQAMEQLGRLGWHDTAVFEPPEQIELAVVDEEVNPAQGSGPLGEPFSELS